MGMMKTITGIIACSYCTILAKPLVMPIQEGSENVSVVSQYELGDITLEYSSLNGWRVCGGGAIIRSSQNGVPLYSNEDLFVFNNFPLEYISGVEPREYKVTGLDNIRFFYFQSENNMSSYWKMDSGKSFTAWFGGKSIEDSSNVRMLAADGLNKGKTVGWALIKVDFHESNERKKYTYTSFKNIGYNTRQNGTLLTIPCGYEIYLKSVATEGKIKNDITTLYWSFKNPSPKISYRLGAKWVDIGMLDSVNVSNGSDSSNVTFKINWEKGPFGQYRINSICSENNEKPAITYEYFELKNVFTPVDSFDFSIIGGDPGPLFGINTDIVDFDNDGRNDFVNQRSSTGLLLWYNRTSDENRVQFVKDSIDFSFEFGRVLNRQSVLVDFDNDGDMDLVKRFYLDDGYNTEYSGIWENRINENKRCNAPKYIYKPRVSFQMYYDYKTRFLFSDKAPVDMNGDGFFDIVSYTDNQTLEVFHINKKSKEMSVYHNNNPEVGIFVFKNLIDRSDWASSTICELYDINGDGLPDQLIKNNNDQMGVRHNIGYSFSEPERYANEPDSMALSQVVEEDQLLTISDYIDINSDGLPDRLIQNKSDSLYVYFNNGCGFEPGIVFILNDTYHVLKVYNDKGTERLTWSDFVDINGDGFMDRCNKLDGGPLKMWLNPLANVGKLKSECYSSGKKNEYSYKTFQTSTINSPASQRLRSVGTGRNYTLRRSPLPLTLVNKIKQTDSAGTRVVDLSYVQLKYEFRAELPVCSGIVSNKGGQKPENFKLSKVINGCSDIFSIRKSNNILEIESSPNCSDCSIEIIDINGRVLKRWYPGAYPASPGKYYKCNIPASGVFIITAKKKNQIMKSEKILIKK